MVRTMLLAALAKGIRPLFRPLVISNLIERERALRLNQIGFAVAASLNVTIVHLEDYVEDIYQSNIERLGLDPKRAFEEVGPKHTMAGSCFHLPGTQLPEKIATNFSIRAGECTRLNEKGRSEQDNLLLIDGTHWCPDVIAGWGAILLRALAEKS